MFRYLIEKLKFFKKFGRTPTVNQFIEEWAKTPEDYFFGVYDEPLRWNTFYDSIMVGNLPDSHGLSVFPDILCEFKAFEYSLLIGYIQKISMHSGGVVCIKHFALNSQLTSSGIGLIFFNAIKRFFKSQNAIAIEFRENHSTKIEHYRTFFEKLGVAEIEDKVWRIALYQKDNIPKHVLKFQEALLKENNKSAITSHLERQKTVGL